MKKFLIVATALVATATAADAKCTKKSLNGSWAVGYSTVAAIGTMASGTFTATLSGSTVTFTLSSFNSTKCRGTGTGTFGTTPVTVNVASEKIPTSDVSPNHLLVTMTAAGGSAMLTMQRQ
jgi:hypothetical protein